MPAGGRPRGAAPRHGIKVVKGAINHLQGGGELREGPSCLLPAFLPFYNTLSRSGVGRGGSIENSFNSTSEFGEISMSRPLRGRPSDLKRGEGRGGARQYFKNVGEGGREGGRAASEHAPRWNVRYPISPMALLRETNDRARPVASNEAPFIKTG